VGQDGKHVGIVDRIEGDRIKLTRPDAPKDWEGRHYYIDKGLVDSVGGDLVMLSVDADSVPTTANPQ